MGSELHPINSALSLGTVASTFLLASFLDLASTFHLLTSFPNAIEANPVMALAWRIHPLFFALVKAIGVGFVTYLFFFAWHDRAVRITAAILTCLTCGVAASNLTLIITA